MRSFTGWCAAPLWAWALLGGCGLQSAGATHGEPAGEASEDEAVAQPATTGAMPAAIPPDASPLGELVAEAPYGGDSPSRYRLDPRFLGDHGDPGEVVRALVWDGRVLYVDPDFVLWELGAERPIAERVHAEPKVSPDGTRLAYVAHEGGGGDLRAAVHVRTRDGEDRVVDRSLFNFGHMRFAPDGRSLLGLGVVNGGVTGLHVVELAGGARCMTNCSLRSGTDWGDAHVELPQDMQDVPFEGGRWVIEGADEGVAVPGDDPGAVQ